MNKVIRDGKVAVLYSPGYGSGWYTWSPEYPEILYDPIIVEWIEENKPQNKIDAIKTYIASTYPNFYLGSNLTYLEIKWIHLLTQFRIRHYDGYEHIEYPDKIEWHIA